MSLQNRLLKLGMRLTWRVAGKRIQNLVRIRRDINFWSRFMPRPFGVKYRKLKIDDLAAEWVIPRKAKSDQVLLFLHGGAFAMCSIRTHRRLVGKIAKAADVRALLIDYCLAPEEVFPAALNQACAAYEWLLREGYKPENIAIGGDSAGGGLTLSTLLKLRDDKLPLPKAAILLSPWTDLEGSGESNTKADQNSFINNESLKVYGKLYAGNSDIRHPLISPIYGDLTGLPPMLIQVGAEELIYDDSARLYAKAKAAGVDATLESWKGMVHVWHVYDFLVPEGGKAIKRLGKYLRSQLDKPVNEAAKKRNLAA
jgi:acetyl esterase/lipase